MGTLRAKLGSAMALAVGLLLRLPVPAHAGQGWRSFNGSEAGTMLCVGTSMTVHGQGSAPRWGAFVTDLHLQFVDGVGQQPGTWSLTLANGTLSGVAGFWYTFPTEANWALLVQRGTGAYAGASGWIYWFGTLPPGEAGPYTAVLQGNVFVPR